MTDLQLDHHGDGSPDLVTDFVLYPHKVHPNVKYWEGGVIRNDLPNLSPRLIVLKAKRDKVSFGKDSTKQYCVYKLHCMDGSETLIRAVTATGMSLFMEHNDIVPGSTILISEYDLLVMNSSGDTKRMIILIKDMSWRNPPGVNTHVPPGFPVFPVMRKRKEPEPPVKMFRLAWRALHKVEREAIVVFTVPVLDQPDIYVWNKMMNAEAVDTSFVNGDWIQDPVSRQDWIDEFDPKKYLRAVDGADSDDDKSTPSCGFSPGDCECRKLHDLAECALVQVPLCDLDFDLLLMQGRDGCSVQSFKDTFDEADSWEDLPNNCKRWSCYTWYALNIFQLRGKCEKLPSCVQNDVRRMFPNPHGRRYVGFRSKEERGNTHV